MANAQQLVRDVMRVMAERKHYEFVMRASSATYQAPAEGNVTLNSVSPEHTTVIEGVTLAMRVRSSLTEHGEAQDFFYVSADSNVFAKLPPGTPGSTAEWMKIPRVDSVDEIGNVYGAIMGLHDVTAQMVVPTHYLLPMLEAGGTVTATQEVPFLGQRAMHHMLDLDLAKAAGQLSNAYLRGEARRRYQADPGAAWSTPKVELVVSPGNELLRLTLRAAMDKKSEFPMEITFSKWGEPKVITPPARAPEFPAGR
ncbi:hypothetical protein [Amycolatopsis suaedae]|uniref:Uncharacterized protein n=1 Tax=Amycolatopsis suaedae TaxID=2510978 RepID=A0A4Q7J669_9PSEU|nr:hypothetical protein [Amycolatopsis suaedae]RZQ62306.1 hypothetical protein EWH70_18690 [Amycolatopsis suaedae]